MASKEPISFKKFIKVKDLTDLNPESLTQLENILNMNQNWILMKQND